MKQYIIFFLAVFLYSECSVGYQKTEAIVYEVSFVKLIASPKLYDGKKVSVSGYFLFHMDEPLIFKDKESIELFDMPNSLPVSWKEISEKIGKRIDFQYVNIQGVYRMKDRLNDPSGVITDIEQIELKGSSEIVWRIGK